MCQRPVAWCWMSSSKLPRDDALPNSVTQSPRKPCCQEDAASKSFFIRAMRMSVRGQTLVCAFLQGFLRSLGNGVRKNGVRNRCPYRRCGVDTEIPYRLPFWREFCLFLPVRVAPGVDTEFPYRVRIVDRGVDCRDPVCRHHFRFLDFWDNLHISVSSCGFLHA